jgi:hypothetical protein
MESTLITWERKIFRKIRGPTCENGFWSIKINQEICNEFKSPDIVTVIKVHTL